MENDKNKKHKTMKKITLSMSLLLLALLSFGQALVIKLNPELNKTYKFKTLSNQTLTQTMGNNEINTYINTIYTTSLKIIEKTNDFFVCEVKFDSMWVSTRNFAMSVEINSNNPGNIKSNNISDVLSAIIHKYCNTPLFLKINDKGIILEIINFNVFKNIILKDIDSINQSIQPQVKMQVLNMIDEKQIKNNIEPIFSYIPEKQINKNESWKKVLNTENNGIKLTSENTYKISNIENKNLILTVEANISSSSDNITFLQGNKVQYDLKGISKGNIKVDRNNGFIIEQSLKSSIEGNINVDYGGNNMNIPMRISGETKIIQL